MTRVAMIVNPTKVADATAFDVAVSQRIIAHGWEPPMILWTTSADPGRGMAEQAVRDGAEIVMTAGGDGTVAAVVSGLVGTGVALAVLPVGTGNLLARNLDLPMDLDSVLAAVLEGQTQTIDVGEVLAGPAQGRRFAVMAGLGFDAAIVADAPARLKSTLGWAAYIVSAVSHLGDPPFGCTISIDGGPPVTRAARTVLVANVATLQAGMDLAPDAGVTDGLLDIIVISPQNVADWVRVGARIAVGSSREGEPLERFQARRVEIRTQVEQVCQLDGDPVGPASTFIAEVRPHALSLRLPQSRDL